MEMYIVMLNSDEVMIVVYGIYAARLCLCVVGDEELRERERERSRGL